MANYKCPSCGARYNGKRCRSCLYEHFSEEIAHRNHTHQGEPLVIDSPVRKPIRRKDPFGCDRKTRKKRKGSFAIVLALLLTMVGPILGFVTTVVLEVADRFAVTEPEPVAAVPEEAMVLFADQGLRVLAQWKNGQPYTDGIRIWVENNTGYDLMASAFDTIVNDCMLESAHFHCEVRDGSMAMNTFYLNEDELKEVGIQGVAEIRFHLEFIDQRNYESICTSPRICLKATPPEGVLVSAPPEGTVIYDNAGIRISCLGYQADEHHPEQIHEGTFQFHIENDTDSLLQIYPWEIRVNGEHADLSFWCQLYPHTRTVTTMYLYKVEDLDIRNTADLFPMELTIAVSDQQNNFYYLQSDPIILTAG